ncbi:hypothetical protein B9Z55_008183 [Caenorhabditis nigoni]|uniref:Uncharacterized protein n=1 Tax=Caenorhabditis nigoni TaxID=1611254 RepID=A0A2G5VD23_9PELO|nr:hypothetical protein B9Z55_008183 [Caenorhabditis nigoni]
MPKEHHDFFVHDSLIDPLFYRVQARKILPADAFKIILRTRKGTTNKIILAGDRRPTARQPPVGSKCSTTETPGQE